jgi:hypothetical protein
MMRRTHRKLRQTPIFKNLHASVTTAGESRSGLVTVRRRSHKAHIFEDGPIGEPSKLLE